MARPARSLKIRVFDVGTFTVYTLHIIILEIYRFGLEKKKHYVCNNVYTYNSKRFVRDKIYTHMHAWCESGSEMPCVFIFIIKFIHFRNAGISREKSVCITVCVCMCVRESIFYANQDWIAKIPTLKSKRYVLSFKFRDELYTGGCVVWCER